MARVTKLMKRLNPKNSLFGRILVWFWIAVTLMIVMAFFIARYFSQSWEISATDTDQLQRVQMLQQNVQKLLNRDIELERALRRAGSRGRLNLMAINTSSDELVLGFPRPLLTQQNRFLSLKDAQQPLVVRTNNMEFVGPFLVKSKQQDYQLFIGRLLRREERPHFAFGLAFFVFLLTGTVACIAIAWTIAKPIKQLSLLSKDFAAGLIDVTDSVHSQQLKNRKDELGQLHNDIQDMATNLAKSLTLQKALLANVSHELRTPLTRLQLALAMLNPSGEDQLLYAKRIEKDIGVMDVMIGQALQLAKMGDENQAQWMQMKITDLRSVLSPVFEDLEFEASASGIDLQIDTYKNIELPIIQTSFVSAIENVTRNAIKYGRHNVKISIDIQAMSMQNINRQDFTPLTKFMESDTYSSASKISVLSIKIEDDGKGLSSEQMPHIFEPFYRVPSGAHYQGTGLGLAIAKAAVQLHEGEIKADTSPMGGLCVTMLFPLKSKITET